MDQAGFYSIEWTASGLVSGRNDLKDENYKWLIVFLTEWHLMAIN
jgi:hypothetical protein